MKVWITKYALTSGMFEAEVKNGYEYMGDVIQVKDIDSVSGTLFCKNDCHVTKAEAIEHAEKLREKKIISLERQLKKIKNLKF